MPSLTVAGAAQVGGPRRGDAPCFPFDCARQKPRASTETRASVGRAGAVRQGGQKSSRRSRPAVAGAGHARRRRRHALCYRMRAFGARARIRASGPTGNRKRCARAACAAPATVSRLRRARRASRPHATVPADGKAAGRHAASPDTGRRTGRAALAERPVFRGGRKRARNPRNPCHPTPGRQAGRRTPRPHDSIRSTPPTPARARRARGRPMMRVALGIGCRAGRPAEAIEAAIRAALARLPQASLADVGVVATLDAKAREPGLVACCARHGWPLVAFSRDEIAAHLARLAGLARAGSGSGVGASPAPGAPPCAAARALRRRRRVRAVRAPCRAERRAHRAQARARRRDGRARGPAVTRAARGLPIHEPNDSQDSSR